jgi:hypothetical protein
MSLKKKLNNEEHLPNIIIENIELRAASRAVGDLVNFFPADFEQFDRCIAATSESDHCLVTLQDVFNEYAFIISLLEHAHASSSDEVKKIHERGINNIKENYKDFLNEIESNPIPLDKRFLMVLEENSSNNELPPYLKELARCISSLFACLIDEYAFHRVVSISDEYKVVLIAGGSHSRCVEIKTERFLGAKKIYEYGQFAALNNIKPLTTEQIKDLITM